MKNTTPAAKLSPAQSAYADALATVRALAETRDEMCKEAGLVYAREMTDEDFERVSEGREAIEEALGYWTAKSALSKAEDAMVRWSLEHATRFAKKNAPQHEATVAGLYERAKLHPKAWEKLVDIAFRLAA